MSFDRGTFEDTLDRVGTLLGELWAVDQCLDRWRSVWEDADENNGFAATSPYGMQEVDVHIGRTSPFTLYDMPTGKGEGAAYGQMPTAAPPLVEPFDTFYVQGTAWGVSVAHAIRSAVEDVVRPVSSSFEEASEIAHSQIGQIALGLPDDFAQLDNNLAHWRGQAADSFGDWYSRMEFIARQQAFFAECLSADLAGAKAVVDTGQQVVMKLVQTVEDSIRKALEARKNAQPVEPPDTEVPWLLIGAAVLGVIAAIPTGGASLATAEVVIATADVASVAVGFAADTVPDEVGGPQTFQVNRAEDMMDLLNDNIEKLGVLLRAQWTALEDTTKQQIASLASDGEGVVFPRSPGIDSAGPGGFHHDSSAR